MPISFKLVQQCVLYNTSDVGYHSETFVCTQETLNLTYPQTNSTAYFRPNTLTYSTVRTSECDNIKHASNTSTAVLFIPHTVVINIEWIVTVKKPVSEQTGRLCFPSK